MYAKVGMPSNNDTTNMILKYLENTLHDIKTPFSIIFYTLQGLENRSDLPEDVKKEIEKMKTYCFKISELICDTNDSNKIAMGKFAPKYVDYDIVSLAESITQSIAPLSKRKNIDIIFDTNTEEKIMAIDKTIFERILLNLLSNAIKFSIPNSNIFVNLIEKKNNVFFEIIDSGKGIDSATLDKIFTRYETSHTPDNENGTGIGLDIVKDLIFTLNGNIRAKKNTHNSGTTICFSLPVFNVDDDYDDDFYEDNKNNILQIGLSEHFVD